MWGIPISLLVSFAVFSAFQFYVSKHVREYAGASTGFGYFLTAFAAAALLFQLGWWVYYGVTRGWLSAGKLAAVGALILVFGVFPLETLLTAFLTRRGAWGGAGRDLPAFISLAGLVALPLTALFMLRAL